MFIKQTISCFDLIRNQSVVMVDSPFDPIQIPSCRSDSLGWCLQMYTTGKNRGSQGHNLSLFHLASEKWKPGFDFSSLSYDSLLSCYMLIYCVIGKCAPPPETPFNLPKNRVKGKGNEILSPQNQLFWKVGQWADWSFYDEGWNREELF